MHRVIEEERIAQAERDNPLATIRGDSADIGEYITLKLLPAVVYVHIKSGVQLTGLQILARQIIEHSQSDPTRILLQHRPKSGKFTYHVWLSTKVMKIIDETGLYQKLHQITKGGKRSQTLVIRQNMRTGYIHSLWNLHHSLL